MSKPEGPDAGPATSTGDEAEVPGRVEALRLDLYLAFSHWQARPPTLLKGGRHISKRDLKALCEVFGKPYDKDRVRDEADLPELHFLRELMLGLGLMQPQPRQRLVVSPNQAQSLWRATDVDLAARCLDWFRGPNTWNELARLPGVEWNDGGPPHETSARLAKARERVLARMFDLGADGGWHPWRAVHQRLETTERDFLVPPYRSRYGRYGYHRYSTDAWHFGGVRVESEGWLRVEVPFIDRVLRSLARFGLLDLRFGADAAPMAFRLAPIGRHLLAGAPRPEEPEAHQVPVLLQPNRHIMALGPLPISDLASLERFADRVRLDRAVELVLTRESVYRGQRLGLDAASITAELERLTGQSLPQNIARDLAEWQVAHERVTIRRGVTLLQTTDAASLDRFVAAAGPNRLQPIGDNLALADPRLNLAELGRRVEVPVSRPGPNDARRRWSMDAEGRLLAPPALATLADLGRLQRLAEPIAGGGWRVSRQSARRALEVSSHDAEQQIAAWRSLLGPGMPAWLGDRIRVWSGHFGTARLAKGRLLELPEAAALEALRRDPRWPKGLRPFKAKGPLLLVDDALLELLETLLSDHGIEIEQR
ncbi:MAG: helicase-associated domain-containing protein [Chloroflexi bacterium]|nr:helicase-associated domain-containing protein [Chloroflexota bacterium]